MKTKRFISLLVICCMFLLPVPAFAATYYAGTSIYLYLEAGDSNVQFSGSYHWAQSVPPLASITIVNNNFNSNCNVRVDWYDSYNNIIGTSNVSSNGSNKINGPAGNTHFAIYGSCSDDETPSPQPWSYIAYETDSQGNILIFDVPSAPPNGSEPGVDITPVVNAIEVIQGQLSTIHGQFDNATSRLTAIQGHVNTIQGQISTVQDQFETVIDQLDTVQGQINTLDSHVQDIHDYISTPRTSQPITVNIPQVSIDPTPPPVEEPYQQPYQYNRPTGQYELPPMVDSPGPLPLIPDPVTMEHDLPAVIDQPIQADQPVQVDPAYVEDPIIRDPINMEQPIVQEPVRIEQPIAQDPPMREEPKQLTPFSPEPPIPKSPIINRSEPLNSEAPFTPDPPLTPNPPI